jgi:class 3 adenylate cyclase
LVHPDQSSATYASDGDVTAHNSVVRELPSGTVTFVFTDIEGSTRLLHDLGVEGYASALGEHRRVLRGAFERHGGVARGA